jgi:flavodoxin
MSRAAFGVPTYGNSHAERAWQPASNALSPVTTASTSAGVFGVGSWAR